MTAASPEVVDHPSEEDTRPSRKGLYIPPSFRTFDTRPYEGCAPLLGKKATPASEKQSPSLGEGSLKIRKGPPRTRKSGYSTYANGLAVPRIMGGPSLR